MALVSYRRKLILAKEEVTYGTDPTPTAGANGVLTMNLTLNLTAEDLERELDLPYLAANPSVLVGRMAVIEFDFEPLGQATPGTAAPCDAIMKACAHALVTDAGPPATATYNPISAAPKSATIWFYMGDQRVAIVGCRGTISITNEIKKFPIAHARLVGQFAIPTSTPIVTPTLTAWQDPPAIEMETWDVEIDGVTVNAVSLSMEQRNEVPMHEGSDLREVVLTRRNSGGRIRIYDPGVSVLDVWTMAADRARVGITSTVDGGVGKTCTIDMPAAQISLPQWVEIDGAIGLEFDYRALATTGNDEYTVELR